MDRSLFGVRRMDKIRYTTLRQKIHTADIGKSTAKQKWGWAGHMCRINAQKLYSHLVDDEVDQERDDRMTWMRILFTGLTLHREMWRLRGQVVVQR